MSKLKLAILIVIALFLVASPVIAASIDVAEEIDVEGQVEAIGANSITVDGTTFVINDDTVITTGRGRGASALVTDISVGVWVSVSGYTEDNGDIFARKIKIKPWITEDTDPEDEQEDGDTSISKPQHPIAMWMSYRFDLDYDELMEMHGAGMGWGNMVKAYHMAQANPNLGVSGEELLDLRLEGKGWGNITRELGTKPGKAPPAWGRDKERPHHNPNAGPKK